MNTANTTNTTSATNTTNAAKTAKTANTAKKPDHEISDGRDCVGSANPVPATEAGVASVRLRGVARAAGRPTAVAVVAAAVGLILLALPPVASAQGYPARPIRMVIPYTPGGYTDTMGRTLGEALVKPLGQPIVYDNKPGANSLIGADMVAKAAPDGYTIGTVIAAHSVNPSLYQKMPFDAIRDFAPITVISLAPVILVANNNAPFSTVSELVAYAKANPGKLSYGSSGTGAAAHLSMEYFNSVTGTKMTHIPYKGTAPALTDLIGGQIQLMFDVVSSMGQQVKAGKIKAIAIASDRRMAAVAQVPTFIESGVPGFVSSSWAMLLAPAATPPAIVDRLSGESRKALSAPTMQTKFEEMGVIPVGNTPAEAMTFLRQEVEKWGKVVREANVKLDQ